MKQYDFYSNIGTEVEDSKLIACIISFNDEELAASGAYRKCIANVELMVIGKERYSSTSYVIYNPKSLSLEEAIKKGIRTIFTKL